MYSGFGDDFVEDDAFTGGSTRGSTARIAAPKQKSIAEQFNSGSVDFSAAELFAKYDTDNSGTIDACVFISAFCTCFCIRHVLFWF